MSQGNHAEQDPRWSAPRPEGFQLITTRDVPALPAVRVSDNAIITLTLGADVRITDIVSTQLQERPGGNTIYQGLVRAADNEQYRVAIKNVRLEGPEFRKMGGKRRTRRARRTRRTRK